VSGGLGVDHTKIYWSSNIDITKLVGEVSCSCRYIIISCKNYVVLEFDKEEWSIGGVCFLNFWTKQNKNYNTTHKETLTMVFILHKFRHYLLGNKFVFYVNHMALVYLVNKPHVSRIIVRWLLLFLKYDFIVVYKLSKTHVVADALSRLPNTKKIHMCV